MCFFIFTLSFEILGLSCDIIIDTSGDPFGIFLIILENSLHAASNEVETAFFCSGKYLIRDSSVIGTQATSATGVKPRKAMFLLAF